MADALRPARRALPERGRPRDPQQLRQPAAPADGYIWDFATRAGVSVRSYGVRVLGDEGRADHGRFPGSRARYPSYPPYDLSIPDNQRVDVWLEEFRRFEKGRRAAGAQLAARRRPPAAPPGRPTPRAFVAERTRAGRLVERSRRAASGRSHDLRAGGRRPSGPDHVDAPLGAAGGEPVDEARQRRLDALHHFGRAAHDGARAGTSSDELYDAAATPAFAASRRRAICALHGALGASRSTRRTGPTRPGPRPPRDEPDRRPRAPSASSTRSSGSRSAAATP